MKTFISSKVIFGAGVLLLAALGVAWQRSNSIAESPATNIVSPATNINTTVAPIPASNAPIAAIAPPTMPPNIAPGSPLAQVIKLTQADIDQNIIMTFITNSPGTFNLDTEKIIYMADVGVPSELVTAMMQRDWKLQQQFASQQTVAQTEQVTNPVTDTNDESAPVAEVETPTTPVTVNYFYDALAPYGSWVEIAGYGRCWRPSVITYDSNWEPYLNGGHWVYTDAGWYWQSDYSWGETFHYGRWFRDARYGWCWWPDTQWSPSWVTWRYSDDYCGWSPLPPFTTYRTGVGFVYRGNAVSVGFNFGLGASAFTFVQTRYLCDPHPYSHRIARAQAAQIYNHTAVVNNFHANGHNHTVVNDGIAPGRISAATHSPVHQVAIGEVTGHRPRGEQSWHDNHPSPANHNSSPVMNQPVVSQTTPVITTQIPAQSGNVYVDKYNHSPRIETPAQNHFQNSAPRDFSRDSQNWNESRRQNHWSPINQPPSAQITPVQSPIIPPRPTQQPAPAQWQQSHENRTHDFTQHTANNPNAIIPPRNENPIIAPAPTPIIPPRPDYNSQHNESHNFGSRPTYSSPQSATPASDAPASPQNHGKRRDNRDN